MTYNVSSGTLNSTIPYYSNLRFVSKILERIIDSRFTEHADLSDLLSPYQSAYCKFHSTETVLVKVHNDIVTAIDRGDIGALAMLDLTSAFDTVDHHILLDVLYQRFAVNNLALDCLTFLDNANVMMNLILTNLYRRTSQTGFVLTCPIAHIQFT